MNQPNGKTDAQRDQIDKHDRIVDRALKLKRDGFDMADAVHQALGELDPGPTPNPSLTSGQATFLFALGLLLLTLLLPALLWLVGHAIIPFYEWGTSWLR